MRQCRAAAHLRHGVPEEGAAGPLSGVLAEGKKRDHRKLGKELELFMFSEEAPGMPFYLPKGMVFATSSRISPLVHRKRWLRRGRTPLMMNRRLWETSGHWDHYKDNMYFAKWTTTDFRAEADELPWPYARVQERLRSYRELPIRMTEFGQVHRHEFSRRAERHDAGADVLPG